MCQSTLTILGLGLKNRHQRAVNPSMAYAQVQAMNLGTSTQVFLKIPGKVKNDYSYKLNPWFTGAQTKAHRKKLQTP